MCGIHGKMSSMQLLDTNAVGVRREKMYKLDDHICCAVAGLTGWIAALVFLAMHLILQYYCDLDFYNFPPPPPPSLQFLLQIAPSSLLLQNVKKMARLFDASSKWLRLGNLPSSKVLIVSRAGPEEINSLT